MKCAQCDRPAMYAIGDQRIRLCLNCYAKMKHLQDVEFLQNAMMMNQALDHMDLVTGIPSTEG